jgi:hypothetical protein
MEGISWLGEGLLTSQETDYSMDLVVADYETLTAELRDFRINL